MQIQPGDCIRFRQWDDMEAEYGLTSYGDIACSAGFTKSMRPLCGVDVFVKECQGNRVTLTQESKELVQQLTNDWWNYSTDMFEMAEQPIKPVNLDLFLEG